MPSDNFFSKLKDQYCYTLAVSGTNIFKKSYRLAEVKDMADHHS